MQVKWSKKASKAFDDALAQGMILFGARVSEMFYSKVKSHDALLATHPHLGRVEPLLAHKKRHEYRSLVVHKHFKLIYYIESVCDTLYIVDLWDTRREPLALTSRL